MDYVLSFKIVFTGDSGCGKSSLVKRYEHNCKLPDDTFAFDKYATSTIGVDYVSIRRPYTLDDGDTCDIKLSIWDTGGQERYNSICKVYYKDISAAIVVFDITNHESFLNIKKWIDNIIFINQNDELLYVIIGNKCDLKEDNIYNDTNKDYLFECNKLLADYKINYIYFETSVKDNTNINGCFEEIIHKLFNVFITKHNIKGALKDIHKVQIDNFSDANNGINVFKVDRSIGDHKSGCGC
jgi:small GTP-binding protein